METKAEKLIALQAMIDSVPSDVSFDGSGKADGRVREAEGASSGMERAQAEQRVELGGDAAKKAYQRVLTLFSFGDYSRAKMSARLLREGYEPEAIEQALDKAVAIGVIDDLRWADMRAESMMRRGMGIPKIERELRENGVEPERLPGWPEDYSERYGEEFDRALSLLERMPPRAKNRRASAYGKLIRRGYSASVASSASAAWDSSTS